MDERPKGKASGKTTNKRTVNFILQGKGGVGKTLIAWLLAQRYQDRGAPLLCYDTDPVQESLFEFSGLNVQTVNLLYDEGLDVESVDGMIASIVGTDADVVVDNGAASFFPMMRYLTEDAIVDMILASGKQVLVHVLMVGGPAAEKTAEGLQAVMENFPPSVRVVVWVNEFFGPVEVDGKKFEGLKFYEQHRDRISLVYLRRLNPQTSGHTVAKILAAHATFAEVLPGMNMVAAQRVVNYRRSIWEQPGRRPQRPE